MGRPNGATTGSSQSECYRFGDVVVDATAHTLTRMGESHPVEPKAFAVLLVLLRHSGQLVHRDDLLDTVWGHRHVTPNVLTRVIAQLRAALDDDPHRPRYIQTQHALGYRFIGEMIVDAPPAAVPVDEALAPIAPAAPEHEHEPVAAAATALAVAPAAATPDRGSRRRWAWFGLTAAVLLAAALFWFGRSTTVPRPAEASIAVLPFTSLGGSGQDAYFARGLAVEMHDALAGVQGLKVAAYPMMTSQDRELDAKALGKLLGVATVLDASVRREGPRVRVSARLTDTRSGFTLWTKTYDRELSDVFTVQSEIAENVVLSLLGVLPGGNRPSLARRLTPTRSIKAYDQYLKGLQQLRQPGRAEATTEAIASFQQALASDAAFARAQAGICRAEIINFERGRDAEAFARARSACLQAEQMDPSLREVSVALGDMYRSRGDLTAAITHYSRALDDVSLRPDAYIGLAKVEAARERTDLALDYIERAHRLRPGDARIQRELGYLHYLSGNLPSAIEAYRVASTLDPDDAVCWSSLGGLYLASGETRLADAAFQRSLKIQPSYGALSNLGTLRYDEGRYADAAMLFRQAAALNPDDFYMFGNIGDALALLPGSTRQSHEAYRRAASMAERFVELKDDDAQALAWLGWYRANLGDAGAAREWLARAEALPTEQAEVALVAAQTYAFLKDEEAAKARLARARALQIPEQRIRSSPWLRRLEEAPSTMAKPGS